MAWLAAQGLAPFAFFRLQQLDWLGRLPPAAHAALRTALGESTIGEAVQHREAVAVLAALAAAGVETVLLKGLALAHTVYPTPRCRPKGDLDLWIPPAQRAAAVAALQTLGYRPHEKSHRPAALRQLTGGEQQMLGTHPGSGLVELQWPAIRGEWVRRTAAVDHAALWARRVPLRLDGQPTAIMAPEDFLIHLCVHLAINHQFSAPWLRGLLDVHLLVQGHAPAWAPLVTRARAWRLATVVWTVLDLARRLLGTAVPGQVLTVLSPSPARRWALGRLTLDRALLEMWPGGYRHRRFLIQTLLVDRPQDAARLVWRALFPEAAWLQARYGASSVGALWRARLEHPWRLLITARA
ncbi:MAG: nucleotidyltransferase family protein [Ardenticatenaceae bacterium]|nr:nucleotidyltransferase family protein [Ardenticatenaceae bacterium]